MIEAVTPRPSDRALEIGTGSGYGAAVLAQVVAEVYTVERDPQLVELARKRFAELGYANIKVLHGDGTLGWPEHAPYNVIIVTAGGPQIPKPLLEQLTIPGRLVIPVGSIPRLQRLVHVTRTGKDRFEEETLGPVQFVPLIGAEGWESDVALPPLHSSPETIAKLIAENAEPIDAIDEVDLAPLLDRIADACGPSWRSNPRNFGILPDARAHHQGTDLAAWLQLRRGRGGLTRCGQDQPVHPACGT
jgi:protein-L-isoaspartate(D-aspartate) O-methyltransferase